MGEVVGAGSGAVEEVCADAHVREEPALLEDHAQAAAGRGQVIYLWDAAAVLRDEPAPTESDVASGDYRIGTGNDQRRIVYSKENLGEKSR